MIIRNLIVYYLRLIESRKMNKKKLMSIAAIVAISAVFVTSSALANPTLAQSNKCEGLSELQNDIHTYEKWFESKQVKIIKMDLPLISYRAIRRNGSLFLTLYKDEWASHVLDKENATIKELYDYYYNLLNDRGFKERELNESLNDLKELVKLRFIK